MSANADLRRRFNRLCASLAHPAVDLDVESFPPVLALFRRLQAAGESFDPALTALMQALAHQLHEADVDGDSDTDSDDDRDDAPDSCIKVKSASSDAIGEGFIAERRQDAA
jgi:hypothetical protein